ncbi:NAD-dependent dehydratase [Petrotoga sp. HWH.PT.55.6.1]|uniref:NAD-dependent 4,6-dehydratase LegB n=1 Tax=unclassified Petrotoga TaxID=2620614 RepID=UPI000CA07A65|nr:MULTISPECIES: NAD-dependent 4,6-dehydratase LegB [unclassified Petrotoga]PNR91807.1 NAD-dependent dehydratase [Petrotoga sp. HWHPT.55.6.3]RPD35583.1 NAD-dependent dehydratase [Petrotoga sp. HWH.PT.55.6.1]
MKVLVTGSEGFIGSHLTELLVEKGFEVKGFVRYNFKNDWGWLEDSKYKNEIEIYTGDIRDYDSVYDAMKDVDAVFHLAALIGIPYSYISPLAYIKTNTEGTYNVLEAGKKLNIERIIHTSTSEIYGTAQYVPIDEKHPYNPQSPYAASKAGADHLALSYYRSFETPVTIIRPFNTFGPRQSARAVIPTIISQILAGKERIKLGNLTPTRDLNYVKDIANGFITVGLHEKTIGDVYNLGTGEEISIGNLAQKIIELIGKNVEIIEDTQRVRPEKSEVERLLSNPEKAKNISGWKPKYSLEEGLKETIQWIQDNLQYYKTDIYNI